MSLGTESHEHLATLQQTQASGMLPGSSLGMAVVWQGGPLLSKWGHRAEARRCHMIRVQKSQNLTLSVINH